MRVLFLLFLLNISFGFAKSLTGPERINPSIEEIARCVPATMQEPIHEAITNLPKAGKITKALYELITGSFSKNCKQLAEHLSALDIDELLKKKNISAKFNDEDKHTIAAMLKDKDTGFENFLYTLGHLESHIAGYVSILHGMLNKGLKLDVIDLIHTVDLIQRGALELQEKFQLLSYLSLAYKEIEGYGKILEGMRHQLSFKIIMMINSLCVITEDLRVTYLSLLDKGDCSGDQISHALGLTQKKIDAIKGED
ncbi:MAG: hypothetical protein WCJ92_00855 [Alphaproteobacteria bacterium]